MADKPRPQGEVERGEHQRVVEAVPGGDRVQEEAEEGEGGSGVQPRQGQGGHAHQRQQGERQLEIILYLLSSQMKTLLVGCKSVARPPYLEECNHVPHDDELTQARQCPGPLPRPRGVGVAGHRDPAPLVLRPHLQLPLATRLQLPGAGPELGPRLGPAQLQHAARGEQRGGDAGDGHVAPGQHPHVGGGGGQVERLSVPRPAAGAGRPGDQHGGPVGPRRGVGEVTPGQQPLVHRHQPEVSVVLPICQLSLS